MTDLRRPHSKGLAETVKGHADPIADVQLELWHAYSTHGGGRCSHYVGDYPTALAEMLAYNHRWGGSMRMERCPA